MVKLRRYQKRGIKWIKYKYDWRVLLADDMGLGKTVQCLKAAKRIKSPIIVICPSTAKGVWYSQALEHVNIRATVIYGRKPRNRIPINKDRMYIINYDILGNPKLKDPTWTRWLAKLKPGLIIIDEGQNLRNRRAIRTKACKYLSRRCDKLIVTGGTGCLEKDPTELWPVLNMLHPKIFNSYYAFCHKYAEFRRAPWGTLVFKRARNLDKLHRRLKKLCMIRRKQEDVLKDLPKRQRIVIDAVLTKRKEYDLAERDFISWLYKTHPKRRKKSMRAMRMVKFGYLLRLVGQLKMPFVKEWLDEFKSESNGKLIVFGVHKKVLKPLHKRYKNSALVTGAVTGKKRDREFVRFNKHRECDFLFGNLKAAGVAWSCTSTSDTAFIELGFNPSDHDQAEKRVLGLGRGKKGAKLCRAFYLIAKNTVEEHVLRLLERKQQDIDQILDGKRSSSSFKLLDELEKQLLKRRTK